jgi:hypothetical protein
MLQKFYLKDGTTVEGVVVQESDMFLVIREFYDFVPMVLWVIEKDHIVKTENDFIGIPYKKYENYKESTNFNSEHLSSKEALLKRLLEFEMLICINESADICYIVELIEIIDDTISCQFISPDMTDYDLDTITFDDIHAISINGPYTREYEKHYFGGDGKYGRAFLNHFDFRAAHIKLKDAGIVSFIWTKGDSTVKCSVAICAPEDNFEKTKAVRLAYKRMVHDKACFEIPIPGNGGYSDICTSVVSYWNDVWKKNLPNTAHQFGMTNVPVWAKLITEERIIRK